ncbi:MAG: glycosyltransferase [Chloroflexi bacterium]|nr:glycosyltransferase [Chloroflexota bacterium]
MRILHILKITRMAGVERHLLTLCPGLRQRGVDARLLLLVERDRPMPEYLRECEQRGIPCQSLLIRHDFDPSLPFRLARAIRQVAPDIAHLHLIHAEIYGNWAARRAGVRQIIVSRHNQDAFRERRWLRFILRQLWKKVTAAIVIADHLRWQVEDTERVPATKIHRIHYGLAPADHPRHFALRNELGIAEEAILLGCVCRLMPQKGLSDGLLAFDRGAPSHAQLVIIGDGPLRNSLEQQAATLRSRDRIHFLGWRQDATRCLADIDILLMPSLWEGFGLVLLEAFSAGIAIIASNVGGIAEVVEAGKSGLLCPPGDIEAFAEQIDILCADGALRSRLASEGRHRFEQHFTAAKMVTATSALYRELLEARG